MLVGIYFTEKEAMSSLIPGPIVEESVAFLIFCGPIAKIKAFKFSSNSSDCAESLPSFVWITGACASVLNTNPSSLVFKAAEISSVTVLFLGLGIKPAGPKILAILVILGMNLGVETTASKSRPGFNWLLSISVIVFSSPQITLTPATSCFFSAKTRKCFSLVLTLGGWGRETAPFTFLSATVR